MMNGVFFRDSGFVQQAGQFRSLRSLGRAKSARPLPLSLNDEYEK
jgi:hypothetical protein